jgi:phosphate transport system substrate-binding protein
MMIKRKRLIGLICVIISLALLSSCAGGGKTEVVIAGSTSVQPYMEMLSEEYALINPNVSVNVQGGGSSMGIRAASERTADIGMSSRPLNDNEAEEMLDFYTVIAKDGLAIIVHRDNPVYNLSIEDVRNIYNGKITDWSEVYNCSHTQNCGFSGSIHLISREEGSGTREGFEKAVMEYKDENGESVKTYITPKAMVQSTNGTIMALVAGDVRSIGYISLGLVAINDELPENEKRPIKGLELGGTAPTAENVRNGSYGLFREFLIVAAGEKNEETLAFIDYVLNEGQAILAGEGLVPVKVMEE